MACTEWNEVERSLADPKVNLAMRARCEEQEHQWENCCSVMFQLYKQCKWCGEKR